MISRISISLLVLVVFSSCEVMYRYFITVNNRMANTKITVKVNSYFDLPKKSISINRTKIYDYSPSSLAENFFQSIPVTVDSASGTYQFILPVASTVFLYPTKIGPPAIEYVVLNDKDTIAVPGSKKKTKSDYKFKRAGNQKFILTIKPNSEEDQ